jgi:thiol-disulfide isomerase/thioredoxin
MTRNHIMNRRKFSLLLLAVLMQAFAEVAYGFTTIYVAVDPVSKSVSSKSSNTFKRTTSSNSVATEASVESLPRRSFRSRVQSAIIGEWNKEMQRKVEIVEDVEEFKKIVQDESQNVVAVMFYSPVCKACQAAKPLYNKLAQKYTQVKFISVPMTEANSNGLASLGVSKFPFGQIYDPKEGLVDEVGLLRKLIPHFEESLRSYVAKINDRTRALEVEDEMNG